MEDEKVFLLHADAILEYNILVGEELDEKDFLQALQKSEWLIACASAVQYLSRQLKTTKQLRTYLIKKHYSPETIDKLIDKMHEYNLVNDEQYATSYTTSMQKTKSKMYVRNKLREAGIDNEIINKNMEGYDEKNSCANEVSKYFKNHTGDKKNVEKLIRHLQYKGYGWETINSCLKNYMEEVCE